MGTASGNWKLDDDGGTGIAMDSHSRAALMAKLGQAAGITVPTPAAPIYPGVVSTCLTPSLSLTHTHTYLVQGGMSNHLIVHPSTIHTQGSAGPPPIGGMPSRALLVKNMFDLASETEDGWELDIKDDVEDECSKHGRILHCFVDKFTPGGFVYLLFANQIGATKSAQGLNGRWFAGRMITVDYMPESLYVTKFPEVSKK